MAHRKAKKSDPEHPPGHFVSDELRTETARFLDELKKRLGRSKAEEPKLGPPRRPK